MRARRQPISRSIHAPDRARPEKRVRVRRDDRPRPICPATCRLRVLAPPPTERG